MVVRSRHSRSPVALALFIALSGACGGGGDEETAAAEYETVPGPNVPQAPAERRLSAEGQCTLTPSSSGVASAALLSRVEGSTIYAGRESGFNLEMACGDTVPEVQIALYFSHGTALLRVERRANRWTVDGRSAEIVATPPEPDDAGAEADAGADAEVDAAFAPDASAPPPPPASELVNGVGLPGTDGTRRVFLALVAGDVRYDIRATIPWRASVAPATCQVVKPGTGTKSSSGGCGGSRNSSSRRSSGGDWY